MSPEYNDLANIDGFLPLSSQDFRVLLILGNEALHGYGVVKASTAQGDPSGSLELGSLYRIINRLVQQGLIAEAPEPADQSRRKRRLYRATDLGRRVTRAEAHRLRHLLDTRQAMDLMHG